MTADSRYPWMHPVDGRPLPGVPEHAEKRVLRWARAIADRSMLQPWFNARSGAVHFCMGSVSAAPVSESIMGPDGSVTLPAEDDVCRRIYSAREPMRRKLARMERAERSVGERRQRAIDEHQEALRPERKDRARRYLEKLDVGRKYRPAVTRP